MKRLLSALLCVCVFVTLLSGIVFGAATNIKVTAAGYFNNGDVKKPYHRLRLGHSFCKQPSHHYDKPPAF